MKKNRFLALALSLLMALALPLGAFAEENEPDTLLEGLVTEVLEQGFVMKDLNTYSKAPGFVEHTTRLYKEYPEMVEQIFLEMFTIDGQPAKKMFKKITPIVMKAGIFNLMKDGIRGVGAI